MIRARTYNTFTANARATGAASRRSGIHSRTANLGQTRPAAPASGMARARLAAPATTPIPKNASRPAPATARIAMPAAVTNCLTTSVAVTAPRRSCTESGTVSVAATLATTTPTPPTRVPSTSVLS